MEQQYNIFNGGVVNPSAREEDGLPVIKVDFFTSQSHLMGRTDVTIISPKLYTGSTSYDELDTSRSENRYRDRKSRRCQSHCAHRSPSARGITDQNPFWS